MILEKDSRFYTTFHDTIQLLKLNTHTLSRMNHHSMLVERIGCYLNMSLKIFNSEHSSDPSVAHEGLHMAIYAWDCMPVAGTDISRCLMVTGCKWLFLYTTLPALILNSLIALNWLTALHVDKQSY